MMPRRSRPKENFWLANLLACGDLKGDSRPHPVRLHRSLRAPNDDGSITCLVDDGLVYISACVQASVFRDFEHRHTQNTSQPNVYNTWICLKKYKVVHTLHNDQNLCEFWLHIEEFTEWTCHNKDYDLHRNKHLVNCMSLDNVRARSQLLWSHTKHISQNTNSFGVTLPFPRLTGQSRSASRHSTQRQLTQTLGISPDLRVYFEKSFRTQPFRIEDFLISDEDKKQLSLIEEWHADFRPPVTPRTSLISGSVCEHEGTDEQHKGSTLEGCSGKQTNRGTKDMPTASSITGPPTVASQQQKVTSNSSVDESRVVMTSAVRCDVYDGMDMTHVTFQSVGCQVHASQDIGEHLVSGHQSSVVDIGIQVGRVVEDKFGSGNGVSGDQGTDVAPHDVQVTLSRKSSSPNTVRVSPQPTKQIEQTVDPVNTTLCPLLDNNLDVMLACTDHSHRPSGSRWSGQDCDLVSSRTAMRNESTNSDGYSDVKRQNHVRGAGRVMCSTQLYSCPLEQLWCLDVSADKQDVMDGSSCAASNPLRPESGSQAASSRVTINSNVQDTNVDDVDKNCASCQHNSVDTVDTVTQRHSSSYDTVDTVTQRNSSSDVIQLSDKQEEERLAKMAKTPKAVSHPSNESPSQPELHDSQDSPTFVPLERRTLPVKPVTSHAEPVICIPLSGSETFTQQPRQKRHESGPVWDVDVMYERKRQRKQHRTRKLYTVAVLLPKEDVEVPICQTYDISSSKKAKSSLTDRNVGTSSLPDSCTKINSSSEHCTLVSPVDKGMRDSGNSVASIDKNESICSNEVDRTVVQQLENYYRLEHTSEHCTPASPVDEDMRDSGNSVVSFDKNDSVTSKEEDRTLVQRLELLFSARVSPIQQSILDLDFGKNDPNLIGFTRMYFSQQKFGSNA